MNIILTQWKNANLDNIKILNPLLGIRFKLKICFFCNYLNSTIYESK